MYLLILTTITLLLSTVVPGTDSCMSWRRRAEDKPTATTTTTAAPIEQSKVPPANASAATTVQPEIPSASAPTTTTAQPHDPIAEPTETVPPPVTIHHEPANQTESPVDEITAVPTEMPSPQNNSKAETSIVIGGPGVENVLKQLGGSHDEPCEESFGQQFCFNDGACFIEQNIDSFRAYCICKKPFSGDRCMQKDPDEDYTTASHHRRDLNDPQPTDVAITETPPVRDLKEEEETINIHGVPCPDEPQYKFLCGGVGRCFMILFSEIDTIIGCECDDPYYGLRCEEKRDETKGGFHGSGIVANNNVRRVGGGRKHRDIDVNKMRRNENRRFHARKLID